MQFGDDYSRVYDSFYEEKDYRGGALCPLPGGGSGAANCAHVDSRSRLRYRPARDRIHPFRSSCPRRRPFPQMLELAAARLRGPKSDLAGSASFQVGDIRDVRAGAEFDAIFCLFHVLSYLPERDDICAAFANARRHAKPGAAYLFDFWYGPAVLANPPTVREKVITSGSTRVRRVSRPEWDRRKSLVDINYEIEITDTASGRSHVEEERHLLRYLFPDEVRDWLTASGFEVVEIGEWMTGRPPNDDSFSVYALARARFETVVFRQDYKCVMSTGLRANRRLAVSIGAFLGKRGKCAKTRA